MGTGFEGPAGRDPAPRRLLAGLHGAVTLALPLLVVAVLAYTVLVGGRMRPVVGARFRGGPTEGAPRASVRVEVAIRGAEGEAPAAGQRFTVELRPSEGPTAVSRGTLDAEGVTTVAVDSPGRSLRAVVRLDGVATAVADVVLSLGRQPWQKDARREGGWVERRSTTGLVIRAALARGVLAVPFPGEIAVEILRGSAPLPGASVTFSPDGAEVTPVSSVTDGHGRVRASILPREHGLSVGIRVRASDGEEATLDLAPAVVPGALVAELRGGSLLVRSPIPRERAYLALVNEVARLDGGTVTLKPDGFGGAEGTFSVPVLPPGPLWAVVSSEADLRSGATVGWPLRGFETEPQKTFGVPDVLLADTVKATVRREQTRARRAQFLGGLLAVVDLLLTAVLVALRVRHERLRLEAHLAAAGTDADTTTRMVEEPGSALRWMLTALLCLAMAATLAFVFATLG